MKRLPVFSLLLSFLLINLCCIAQEPPGACILWTTYEAEQMQTNGIVLQAAYDPFRVETESSGQGAVKLQAGGQYVAFIAAAKANSVIVRYSLPDSKTGGGLYSWLGIKVNEKQVARCQLHSRNTWLYGKYPFSNNPADGKPRHFYDELRVKDLFVEKGDTLQLVWEAQGDGEARYCIIDLIDLEQAPAATTPPAGALWLTDKRFTGDSVVTDFTVALRKCIAAAVVTGKTVWIPAGNYIITGDIRLPAHITINGAGMWHTTLVGNERLYTAADRRVRLIGTGDSIHLADFSLLGSLDYRNDTEPNDGITGTFGYHSTIENIWVEHTKVGMWVENSNGLVVRGCRLRNTIADGINFCVGMAYSTMENCTARGTGDDGFAIWPAVFSKQVFVPGHNLISHCTAQLPFLANGVAVYGGESNVVKNCSFTDITQGAAVLVSTTFPTASKTTGVNNNFTGTTVIENCVIKNSGGFDHEWGWRGAIEICLDRRSITGIAIKNVVIDQSLSDAISIVAKNDNGEPGHLQNAHLEAVHVNGYGIAVAGKHALSATDEANGSLSIQSSFITNIKTGPAFKVVK